MVHLLLAFPSRKHSWFVHCYIPGLGVMPGIQKELYKYLLNEWMNRSSSFHSHIPTCCTASTACHGLPGPTALQPISPAHTQVPRPHSPNKTAMCRDYGLPQHAMLFLPSILSWGLISSPTMAPSPFDCWANSEKPFLLHAPVLPVPYSTSHNFVAIMFW